jgi:hypothetical protein
MYLLNLATCMAESTKSFCHDLAQYLEIRLGIPTQCVAGIPWQKRERLFDQGNSGSVALRITLRAQGAI